jgi:hypothetical protein
MFLKKFMQSLSYLTTPKHKMKYTIPYFLAPGIPPLTRVCPTGKVGEPEEGSRMIP